MGLKSRQVALNEDAELHLRFSFVDRPHRSSPAGTGAAGAWVGARRLVLRGRLGVIVHRRIAIEDVGLTGRPASQGVPLAAIHVAILANGGRTEVGVVGSLRGGIPPQLGEVV